MNKLLFPFVFAWNRIALEMSVKIPRGRMSLWWFGQYWNSGILAQKLNPEYMTKWYQAMYQRLLDSWGPQGK